MKKRGLTIVELLISMAILGVIVSATTALFSSGIQNYKSSTTQTKMQRELNIAIDQISRDVKQAIEISEEFGEIYHRDSDSLIVSLPAMDENENFLYNGSDVLVDHIVYELDGTNLRKKVFAETSSSRSLENGKDITILNNVSFLSFTYFPNLPGEETNMVDINVIISKNTLGKNITFGNNSKAIKRNYK